MKTINYSKKAALVAMLGLAGFAAAAHAGESYFGADDLTVHYSDLNLNTSAGAETLYRRIYVAAKHVCGDEGVKPIDQAASARACVNQAVMNSVRAVNKEQLTRTANAHGFGVQTEVNMASAH